ncbi:class I SAM-dependent methyltransferase [Candidatus Nomurabacteria bacterium]|nr:class I SAM-dependent methyltransferase [Candidatus Nomurabacteria bacterium]
MKNIDLRTQYDNGITQDFSIHQRDKNQINRELMYTLIGNDLKNKKILDLGCGDGIDTEYYQTQGAHAIGIDASTGLIDIAQAHYPEIEFTVGFAEELPYEDNSFDMVLSKYAIQTSADMQPIFDEVNRVLKPGGMFIYLVTHPLRQFMERRDLTQDYFSQSTVVCKILDNTVTLEEPTHTMNEYFNTNFFLNFSMVDFIEAWDPAAEQIGGGKYPGFFIVKAQKK